MSREENLKIFDFYCEEIGEFANNVNDELYTGWGSKELVEHDIEEIERILEKAKKNKVLLESDLKIICRFGEDVIRKINNQINNE